MEGAPSGPTASRARGLSPAAGCALLLVFALTGGVVCFGLGALLFRGEIRLPGAEPAPSRLWLVREPEVQGLALSTSHLVSGSRDSGSACFETHVSFFLWRSDGTAQPTRYCQCYRREGPAWFLAGDCPS